MRRPAARVSHHVGADSSEHVGILTCCTNLFDKRCQGKFPNNKCPMCRAEIKGVLAVSQAVDVLTDAQTTAAVVVVFVKRCRRVVVVVSQMLIGDETHLLERLRGLKSAPRFTASSKAVAEVVSEYLRFKPRGARILLAFACRNVLDGNEAAATRLTRQLLHTEVPALSEVLALSGRRDGVAKQFTTENDTNLVMVINTNDTSVSLEGLDLWNTGMVIIDRLDAGHRRDGGLDAAKIVQTIGRAMRPQVKAANCPAAAAQAANGSEGFRRSSSCCSTATVTRARARPPRPPRPPRSP